LIDFHLFEHLVAVKPDGPFAEPRWKLICSFGRPLIKCAKTSRSRGVRRV
jgi:hypothetical protein